MEPIRNNTPGYLAKLTSNVAIDIELHLDRRNYDFSYVDELVEVLRGYQLKDSDYAISMPDFPYFSLRRAINEHYEKEIRTFPEFALETRILRLKLAHIKHLPKERLENLRDLCVYASKVFSAERSRSYRKRLSPENEVGYTPLSQEETKQLLEQGRERQEKEAESLRENVYLSSEKFRTRLK